MWVLIPSGGLKGDQVDFFCWEENAPNDLVECSGPLGCCNSQPKIRYEPVKPLGILCLGSVSLLPRSQSPLGRQHARMRQLWPTEDAGRAKSLDLQPVL